MGKSACMMLMIGASLLPLRSLASHAMGTDITYECLGSGNYKITVAFYRDCSGISAPSVIAIDYFSASCNVSSGSLIDTLYLQSSVSREVSPLCPADLPNSTCHSGGTIQGVEKYVYSGTIHLPLGCPDWIVGYTECCRNSNITNLVNAASYNLYAYALINNTPGVCDNSPVFTTPPIPYLCPGQPFNYNQGAVDPDGDSLVYKMVQPSDNYRVYIPYDGNFTVNYPMSTITGTFDFEPTTGQITVTPDLMQNAVVTVQVEEYRNGRLIGSTMRDIQIVVLDPDDCTNEPPVISNPIFNINGGGLIDSNTIQMCPASQLTFEMEVMDATGDSVYLSSNASSAVPGSSFMVLGRGSTVRGRFSWIPSAADTGFHAFQVTYSDNGCPVSTPQSVTYVIYVFSRVEAGANQVYCGEPIQLRAFGGSAFSWTPALGLSATNLPNPFAAPSVPTMYYVTSDCGRDSVFVDVQPPYTLFAGRDTAMCLNSGVDLHATVSHPNYGPYVFSWSPATGLDAPNSPNPTASPRIPTTYVVTSVSARGCIRRDTVTVRISGVAPIVNVYADPVHACVGEQLRLDLTANPSSCSTTTTPCSNAPVNYTIGTGVQQTSAQAHLQGTPYKGSYTDARVQYLFRASELNAMGITGGIITHLAFNVAVKRSGNSPYNNFTIKIGCTPLANLPGFDSGLSTVYGPTAYTTSSGWNTHTLTSPYAWDGVSNLVIQICYDNVFASNTDEVYFTPTPFYSVAYRYDGLTAGCNLASADTSKNRPNVRFGFCDRSIGNTTITWSVETGIATISDISIANPTAQAFETTKFRASVSMGGCPGKSDVIVTVDTTFTVKALPDTSLCRPSDIQLNAIASGQPSPIYLNCGTNGTPVSASAIYQVGSGPGYTNNPTPFKGNNHDARMQILYRKSELEGASMKRGIFTSIAFNIAFKKSTQQFRGFTIKMGCTSLDELGGIFEPNLQVVFTPKNISTITGWNTFNLDNPFDWDGFSNVIVEVCFDNNSYVLEDIITYENTPFKSVLADSTDYAPSGGCGLTTPFGFYSRPNTRFGVSPPPLSAFSYSWSPSGTLSGNTIPNPIANPVSTSAYVVTLTDGICISTDTVNINFYTSFDVNVYGTNVGCNGSFDGNAVSVPIGGVTPYAFSWSTGRTISGVSTDTLYNLYAGTYYITVTDNNACSASDSVTLTVPPPLVIDTILVRNVNCYGGNSGTARVLSSGGTQPYSYSWSDGDAAMLATQLSAGAYAVTVTDAGGCTISDSTVVTQPSRIQSNIADVTHVSCHRGSDGTAAVSVSGGTPPYRYRWSDNQADSVAVGLRAAMHVVYITDDSNCVHSDTAVINEPPGFNIVVTTTGVTCFGNSNGTASASVAGDTLNYTFLWDASPPRSSPNITGLPAGQVLLIVTDTAGCVDSTRVRIGGPDEIQLAIASDDISCSGYANGRAAVTVVSGGVPPFGFEWNNSVSDSVITGLNSGTYSVTVFDNNDCQKSDTVFISEPSPIEIHDSLINNVSCFAGRDGKVSIRMTGGTPSFNPIEWSDGQSTPIADNLAAGVYSVTVTDRNGCKDSLSGILVEQPEQIIIDNIQITPTCAGASTGVIGFSTSGGVTPYQFTLDSSLNQSSPHFTGVAEGNHHITIIDNNGCVANSNVIVSAYDTIDVAFDSSDVNLNLGQEVTLHPIVLPADSAYHFSWQPSSGLSCTDCAKPVAAPFVTTVYRVTVYDEYQCPYTEEIVVNVSNNLVLMVPNAFTPNGDGINDILKVYGIRINSLKFRVFDRWGEKLFETKDPESGWDGTFHGKIQPPGAYIYYVEAVFDDGQQRQIKGSTTILK